MFSNELPAGKDVRRWAKPNVASKAKKSLVNGHWCSDAPPRSKIRQLFFGHSPHTTSNLEKSAQRMKVPLAVHAAHLAASVGLCWY
jgi:hypothetical protein